MASLDTLPTDQRAVLELVLRRGRSYDQIGGMLSIDRAGVRARALAALDALGPQTPVSPERRALITDYLLGSLPPRVAVEVQSMLAESPAERAWARVVASELEPISAQPLPEIPVEAGPREPTPVAARVAAPEAVGAVAAPSTPEAAPAPRRSSRLGGAVLLGVGGLLAAGVVAALVIVLSSGSSKPTPTVAHLATTPPSTVTSATGTVTSAAATGTGTATTASGTQVLAQVNMNPPSQGAARGVALVLRVAKRIGIEIRASGLAPNSTHPPNAYAVWLYNSPTDSHILGFVNPGVGKNGQLQTAGGLPADASHFKQVLITLETRSNPRTPGTIVLQGTLSGLS